MARERLLKRLHQLQRDDGHSPSHDDAALIESVLADVQNLLNTIQGTALINDRLGLSDVKKLFVSHGATAQSVITEEIRHNIAQFEPRIGRYSIEQDEKNPPGALRWLLHGALTVRERSLDFSADITLTADGQISISPRV